MSFGEAYVGKNRVYVELDALAAAQVAAYKYGFYDIDLKDNDAPTATRPGNYTIVAYRDNINLTVRGSTLDETVQKLINRLGEKA